MRRICRFSKFSSNCSEISFQITYKSYCWQKFQQQYIGNYLCKPVLSCIKMSTLKTFQLEHE